MSKFIQVLAMMILFSGWGFSQSYTFKVRHDHNPWGKCLGEMTVSPSGLEFRSEDEDHTADWGWLDIQTVDRKSASEFTILSYQDQRRLIGRDRPFKFTVTEGAGLTDEVFHLVSVKLKNPVVDRVASRIETVLYEVPVKHLHTFGGCEGILRFGPEMIVFESENGEDSRSWRKDTELKGVWSSGRYDLDIVVREREGGSFSGERRFRFQLKEPLDEEFYFRIRRELLP